MLTLDSQRQPQWKPAYVSSGTNLSHTADATTLTLFSSTGTPTVLSGASSSKAGLLTSADRGHIHGATELSVTVAGNDCKINATTAAGTAGTAVTLPLVTDTTAGLMRPSDRVDITGPTDLSVSVTGDDAIFFFNTAQLAG